MLPWSAGYREMMIELFDTGAGEVRPLALRDSGKVSMYVCGPTVYGPPHLGHGRFSLVFDVLRRYLEWSGMAVTYVSNITDIDDNIIDRASDESRPWQEIVTECEAEWYEAMDAIGVKRPDHDPHATAYVEEMVGALSALVDRGAAYLLDDGLYFDTSAVADYGLLARQDLESLRSGARVAADEAKRDPTDFVLWKLSKPSEPHWPSPWGDGRPGWHTECVVMSLGLLGDGFDIHGGGQDLAFPHHENERAQACALGRTFAAHWVHNGFVEVGGEKMSKSLGNFVTLGELIDSADPRSYRLLVLQSHYRSPITVDKTTVDAASTALARLDSFVHRASIDGDLSKAETDSGVTDSFTAAMDSDMDTPAAMGVIFDLVRQGNTAFDEGRPGDGATAAATLLDLCDAVGLTVGVDQGDLPSEVAELVALRDEARASKRYEEADRARADLEALGYEVQDGPDKTAAIKKP